MLERLYKTWGLNDHTDFQSMRPEDFPILSDLYEIMEDAYQHCEQEKDPLYPRELLQEVLLGLHSMCKGAESTFFNGHTNVTSHRFLVFGAKDLISIPETWIGGSTWTNSSWRRRSLNSLPTLRTALEMMGQAYPNLVGSLGGEPTILQCVNQLNRMCLFPEQFPQLTAEQTEQLRDAMGAIDRTIEDVDDILRNRPEQNIKPPGMTLGG